MKARTWVLLFAVISLYATTTHAATKYHRVVWDADPARNAVIVFSPEGTSTSPYVKYGYSTTESEWSTQQPSSSSTFAGSLTSYFIRLTNLDPDSAVYYRACDQDGCGERFWFKTAPIDNQPFVVVAGGDTRTGWTTRRQGNRLVAKIRPLFIMHGGDFTNANTASEMGAFLNDWTLTYSADSVNGYVYKRVYPIIPTHGNHEDNNYETLCQVFGVDFNADGICTASDTYGAFDISPLMRVYTLNTQFQNSGWYSHATTMNAWLEDDLYAESANTTWRFAQYHKPMFPHSTSKSDNPTLFNWWADLFYSHAMNVVVESDTHLTKLTKAVRPSGTSFVETSAGGTVYVGEGSWGAPARSANNPRPWTMDLASIQQFKVITVMPDRVELRTAQFDSTASTLSRTDRENNPALLPSNVNWWHANGVGDTMVLIQNNAGQSVIDGSGTPSNPSTTEFSASDDAFIASAQSNQNFDGSAEGLLADGSDATYGSMDALIKWSLSSLPACAEITGAAIQVDIFNTSPGTYNILSGSNDWSETTVTWNSVGGAAHRDALLASFSATSQGTQTVALSNASLSLIQSWLQGNNHGVVITASGTSNGIDFDSKETGSSPRLIVDYQESTNCGSSSI